MTRTVVATFADAEAARRAAVALGRAELAAGPTRVQVDASSPQRGARLELRVDEPDAPRAIALMREHGAAVADGEDERDLRDGGPLTAWGMAVADAVTAAMGGATASDAQVPADVGHAARQAGHGPTDVSPTDTSSTGRALPGASPTASGPAGEPAGRYRADAAADRRDATHEPRTDRIEPERRGTVTADQRDAVARDDTRQAREAATPPRRLGPNAEHDDPDNSDTLHMRLAPGLRRGIATRKRTGPGDEAVAGSSPSHDDSAALNMQGTPRRAPRAPGTPPPTDAAGNPLVDGAEASAGMHVVGAAPDAADDDRPKAPAVVWGNAPSRGPAGTGSGTHLSDTVAAGTESSMGQIGPGSTIAAAMGATDATGTASGTRTRAEPGTLERADDVPIRDPRPPRRRPKSDA